MRWHRWLLVAPFYGRFERSLNTSRFASTLAITISSGVPILRALRTSRDTLSNAAMREQVEDATASVREGMSLARALAVHPHFPPMLIHMIRAGEVTGELRLCSLCNFFPWLSKAFLHCHQRLTCLVEVNSRRC